MRSVGAGHPLRPQARGPPDARAGRVGCHRRRRRAPRSPTWRMRPPRTWSRDFHGHRPRPPLARRHHVFADGEGWLYLAVLLDAHSRRGVGWAMADHLRAELALDALAMALVSTASTGADPPHRPGLPVHRGDVPRGPRRRRRDRVHESVRRLPGQRHGRELATLKAEVAEARPRPTRAAARPAVFEWPEVWYNRQRRHSALNFHAPVTFEEDVLLSCPAA